MALCHVPFVFELLVMTRDCLGGLGMFGRAQEVYCMGTLVRYSRHAAAQ